MEANKAEAQRCIEIGRKYVREGNEGKAKKFLEKATRLDPSFSLNDLLEELKAEEEGTQTANGTAHFPSDSYNSAFFDHYEEPRARRPTQRRSSGAEPHETEASSSAASRPRSPSRRRNAAPQLGVDYTQEQLDAVLRIRHSKDYYEILNVSKDFQETELKKQYRKLALQFHPDKNRAPGATEAFKAIGNSYAVLSDAEKRQRYDMYGTETPAPRRRNSFYEYDYSRGFEAEFTPEEIFNMFFGGGFPSGQVYRRRGHGGTFTSQPSGETQERNEMSLGVVLQLLPVLVLICLSVASQLLAGDPAYSLHRTSKHTVERVTTDLRVPYFVKPDFLKVYRGAVARIEQQVEEDYISHLRMNCYRERSQKEAMAWRARTYGDSHLWERSQSMATPSCDRLNEIYA